MNWFNGSIPEAIQRSKQQKVLFIVYIYGQNDMSTEMDKVWNDPEVLTLCNSSGSVAIKLAANSEACGHFSQIFPVVVVPSTYFIGVNGAPIEVAAGHKEKGEFIQVIQNVIKLHNDQLAETQPGPPTAVVQPNTSAAQSTAPNTAPSTAPNTSTQSAQIEKPPLEERVQKAKEKMEMKREEKEKLEKEKEKEEEKERRKLGKDLQKLKEFQKERELKDSVEQMRKEKAEEKRQRDKIREQIARDREERAARFRKETQEQKLAAEEKKQAQISARQKLTQEEEAKKMETARIQVRLPDGTSLSNTFPSSDILQSVYSVVSGHIGADVTLSTVYPKRIFTQDDMSQTLLSLNLVPSSVLIAVPRKSNVISSPGNPGGGILALILAPFLFLWNMIRVFLFGGPSQAKSEDAPPATEESQPSSQRRPRPQTAYQRRPIRADGNVRRLTDMRDDDDENATWNGNSTQQM
ncbi:UBX domain-containing protein 4-like [Saccostrea echinata]|uniref:UBX domain-containing protein 4-like n=1 Tax=Saccostrea echinata TaxID=191078 RepID=UPI002A80CEC0|nr:UBX domain-containing protein 4-like [Saccostrea echinata]